MGFGSRVSVAVVVSLVLPLSACWRAVVVGGGARHHADRARPRTTPEHEESHRGKPPRTPTPAASSCRDLRPFPAPFPAHYMYILHFFDIFSQKNLHMSKKNSTFAPSNENKVQRRGATWTVI